MVKPRANKVNGILLLNKPSQMTSNGALQHIKRLFDAEKAGHTGSLDPLATGMLPICFGEATKFSQFLLDSDKCYRVRAALGVRTTTGDADGAIIATQPVKDFTAQQLDGILPRFCGAISQVPPMYSALKVNGKPLYKLARRGVEVERVARTVQIQSLQVVSVGSDYFELDVRCSKGTYIRTLIEDMGLVLGCGAHVAALHRTAVEPYIEESMLTIGALEQIHDQQGVSGLYNQLLPMETSLQILPAVQLSSASAFYLRMGQPVIAPPSTPKGLLKVFGNSSDFLGLGEHVEDGRIVPRRLVGSTSHKAITT